MKNRILLAIPGLSYLWPSSDKSFSLLVLETEKSKFKITFFPPILFTNERKIKALK